MSRPDYVKCIADVNMDNKGKAWCGRTLDAFEWAFQDVDHAAQNGRREDRLLVCPECRVAVTKALLNGYEDE